MFRFIVAALVQYCNSINGNTHGTGNPVIALKQLNYNPIIN